MKQQKFSIKARLKSFNHAINGLKILWKEEHNARIHFIFVIAILIAGFTFDISLIEWMLLVFAMGFVITTEIINSSIENIADFVSSSIHPNIKKIKDLAAAAVFLSALTAIVIGLIIFIPKTLKLF